MSNNESVYQNWRAQAAQADGSNNESVYQNWRARASSPATMRRGSLDQGDLDLLLAIADELETCRADLATCQNEHARTRGALTASREALALEHRARRRCLDELYRSQRELRAVRNELREAHARLARIGAPVAGGTRRTRRRRKNKRRRRTRRK